MLILKNKKKPYVIFAYIPCALYKIYNLEMTWFDLQFKNKNARYITKAIFI